MLKVGLIGCGFMGSMHTNCYNNIADAKVVAVADLRREKAEELAKIAQFAENEYFGKPCGLMDQMACAVGGFVYIDFEDPKNPVIESSLT